MMVSFVLSFFPRDVLDEILNLIESVSEDFPSYSFKQAFDNVWRVGLWHKLIQDGVRGKCFNLIINLYKAVKSNVSTPDGSSEFFECHNGVRQVENFSPFLFSIFLNDLEHFLDSRQINGVK